MLRISRLASAIVETPFGRVQIHRNPSWSPSFSSGKMSGPTTSAADQAHVAELKQHMADTSSAPAVSGRLNDIRDVDIDSGIYKYVLIKVFDPSSKGEKYIVRGRLGAAYHADVADPVVRELKHKVWTCLLGFHLDVTGGGRIKKNDGEKEVLVYGYSYGFGRANHYISADLIRKAYPEYKVDWSNDGY